LTGLPTLAVELEDGSGNFTNDVTAYVRLDKGWSLSRGWSDENDEDSVQPAILRLRLDNTDGKFTLGASNFNGITKHKRLRLSETVGGTTYRRVVGYVNDWPTQWDSAMGNIAFASLVVSDRFARMNRRKLRSILEQEILLDAPAAYYTLGEPSGSLSAGDTSGNGRLSLTAAGSGNPVVFGSATGPAFDGLTAVQFAAPGQYLANVFTASVSAVSLEVFFNVATVPIGAGPSLFRAVGSSGAPVARIDIDAGTGVLSFLVNGTAFSGAVSVCDGVNHHAALTYDGATLRGYLDGGLVSSTAVTGSLSIVGLWVGQGMTGTASHAAFYSTALTAARVLAHSNTGLVGVSSDRADQRIARLASYANIATADQNLETGQQPSMATQSTAGQSVLDAMRDVAQAEGGGVFMQGDGKLALHNKSHRVIKACGTPAITVTADLIDPDMTWASDNYLFNTATGTRSGGAQQTSVNAVSVGKYEEWPTDRSNSLLPTDELMLNELQWVTTMYGEPLPRLSAVTFDLLTLPQATVQALLALELGDLMRITGWPAQSPASSIDLIVEGFDEAQTEKSWTLTFNTAPGSLFKAWVLGDSTYSVLDSTTRLYF
jgi:hypothetical protein